MPSVTFYLNEEIYNDLIKVPKEIRGKFFSTAIKDRLVKEGYRKKE